MTTPPPSDARPIAEQSVAEYVAMQPRYAWRRALMRGFARVLFGAAFRLTYTNTQNVPDTGGAILLMNHISLLDPILCIAAVRNRFVLPMSKVENSRHPIIGPLVRFYGGYTVNRGEVDRKALTNSIELIKSGQLILIAPEGTRQDNGLTQPKDGLAFVATKADAIIIPAAISGAQTWMDDLKKLRRVAINVNFGRPFRFKTDGRARIPREALGLMSEEAMYQLAAAIQDPQLRGVYADLSKATSNHLEFLP
jgi:1-acyl-sn-glycerol-3-phosphate acyltransferase